MTSATPLPDPAPPGDLARRLAPNLVKTHACEEVLGYRFRNPWLLWETLQANGSLVCFMSLPRYEEGNMRLAILGDKILDFLLAMKWYPTFEKRAAFDRLRTQVTSNASFIEVGNCYGLSQYIDRARCASDVSPVTMSATVEAIVGAAYLDGGHVAAATVVQTLGIQVLAEEPFG
ncbi:MAG: hypothetical protein L6R40_005852 [Gallowayella cf. fulva]|nr:MAG: hypothetical protein L6R40_005852 [Xanthomendoza cf. fulva]